MQEIIVRIEIIEGRYKGAMKECAKESFVEKLRKRLEDKSLSIDYLKDLKSRILRLASLT